MKYTLSLLLPLAMVGSCRTRIESPRAMNPAMAIRQKAIDEIREADQKFSILSEKQGMPKAFMTYASDDVIKMNEGAAPTVGFDSLRAQLSRVPSNSFLLTWRVLRADAAQSGELGYTFGEWMLTPRDDDDTKKSEYGVYVTVWKRQRNGQWRFVIDGGNTTPEPN